MNAVTSEEGRALSDPELAGLKALREPIPPHLISKLPKGTKAQNQCDDKEKVNCRICGGWHHPKIRHLDYVGHAAATHMLLDADPRWSWEPLGYDEHGLPKFDNTGGLWIKLTVQGVTRLGYGHADHRQHADSGAREKEVIGDAIRNAAMRFGLALELWSKADIHAEPEDGDDPPPAPPPPPAVEPYPDDKFVANLPTWQKVIADGRKTPAALIAMVESGGRPLTDAQKKQIRDCKTTTSKE